MWLVVDGGGRDVIDASGGGSDGSMIVSIILHQNVDFWVLTFECMHACLFHRNHCYLSLMHLRRVKLGGASGAADGHHDHRERLVCVESRHLLTPPWIREFRSRVQVVAGAPAGRPTILQPARAVLC